MELNKGAVGIFVILCVIGGATGFYLATSGNPEPVVAAPLAIAPDSAAQPEPILDHAAPPVQTRVPASAAPAAIERPAVRRSATPARPARPDVTREPAVVAVPAARPASYPDRGVTRNTEATAIAAPAPVRPSLPEPIEATEPAPPQFVEAVV